MSIQQFTIRDDGTHQVTLSFYGKLDVLTAPEASAATHDLVQSIPSRWTTVIVDLSGLDLIDSTGVSVLVSLHKRAQQNGGHVRIVGIRDQPLAIFRLLRLDRVFVA